MEHANRFQPESVLSTLLGVHVAFMLRGAADRFRKSLEIHENKLQHAQHEIGRNFSDQFRVKRCSSMI